MKRHLVISPQQFRKCLFLYYFLPFFFDISRDLKWVKMSFTLTHKRSCKTCHRSCIFEEPGTETRFCCSIKLKLHSANSEISPSAGTFLFLFPNLQALLGCVLCTRHPFSRERKKTLGHKGSFNSWTERRNWVRNAGVRCGQMRSQKGSILQSVLSGWEWSKKVVQD